MSEVAKLASTARSAAPKESAPKSNVPKASPISAFLETLLINPPVPPLPNSKAFGPLRISNCSTLYKDL